MSTRVTIIGIVATLAAGLVPISAAECKAVHAMYLVAEEEFISPCGEFEFCLRGPVVGTFNGTMTFQWDPGFASTFDPWSEGSEFNLYHGYELIETNHGTVTGVERGLFGFDTSFVAAVIEITGGTGIYEGASGRLAWFAKGMSPESYYLEGRICTP